MAGCNNYILRKQKQTDYSQCKSYRSVSLLPILERFLEKVVIKKLQHLAETRSWMAVDQLGFRQKHSAPDAVLNVVETIKQAFQQQRGVTCLTLDIEGAYDNGSHQTLTSKLCRLSCPERIINWIISYLTNRALQTTHAGTTTDHFWTVKGVPQEPSLSPLLFAIYIDLLTVLNDTPGVQAQDTRKTF